MSVCSGKCIIAANLYNSEDILPNLIIQLVRAAQLLGPTNILVSIYESGSTDTTPVWLQLLSSVLGALGVPNIITVRGDLTRGPGQDRIAFLAAVRQAAVDQVLTNCKGPTAPFCSASRIIFLNDVFFDAAALIRLLQHDPGTMACAMDFEPILADHPPAQQRTYMAQHLHRVLHVPQPVANALSTSSTAFRLWRRAFRRAPSLHQLLPLSFYDVWVSRDITGSRFLRPPPYTRHEPTAAQLRAGLPVAAYCCWNGMAALPGPPLLTRRIRFRAHRHGECAASECSLLCEDLRGAGYTGPVVIDPGVRVAYRAVAASRIYGGNSGGVSGGNLGDGLGRVDAASKSLLLEPEDLADVEWSGRLVEEVRERRQQLAAQPRSGLPATVECCGLLPGRDSVDFEHGCVREPVRQQPAGPLM